MYCKYCGAEVNYDTAVCPKCGAVVNPDKLNEAFVLTGWYRKIREEAER